MGFLQDVLSAPGNLIQSVLGGGNSTAQGGYSGGAFTPPNMTGAANNAYTGVGNLAVSPYAAPMAQAAYGQAGQTLGAGNQLYQTSLDPQQQLYNRMYGLTQNQSAANQASRGLAMSPVGAQMSNQAGQNFNMDWQNQQLARQAQGLQGMTATNASAGNLGNLALNYSNQPNVLNQQQIGDWMAYTGQGQQGAGTGVNAFNATAPYQAAGLGWLGSQAGGLWNSAGGASGIGSWLGSLGSSGASAGTADAGSAALSAFLA